jgi:flagellar protein FliJ
MKFKFRLQSVYDLRQHLESEQKDKLEKERQKLMELFAERENFKKNFELWSRRYMGLAGGGMTPTEAVRIGRYLDDLDKKIILISRQIEKQNDLVEKERLILIERMRDRKTMETLYDKQFERFRYDENKKEEKEIEELISSRR